MSEQKSPQGWGWPINSRKAHYFREGDSRSLCNKWLFFGTREDYLHDASDNCADCRRRRERLVNK